MQDAISETFDTNGFCVLDHYLASEIVEILAAEFEDSTASAPTPGDPETSPRIKRGVVFARRNLLNLATVREFIFSERVQSIVDRLSPGLIPVRGILFDKTGGANWTVPWHQDRSIAVCEKLDAPGYGPWSKKAGVVHVQPPLGVLEKMLTLRFSLDVCGPENGPLRVIAGTHQRLMSADEVAKIVQTQPEAVCATSAGGVVIMRPLLLHASSPAKYATRRRVLHIEFGPPTLPGGVEWAMV